ncbi:MAG: TonB-dependent receptor [Cytophagales bacterium]|nr:MAG: TonB-dependent receptor [Cytophagales bacterium]
MKRETTSQLRLSKAGALRLFSFVFAFLICAVLAPSAFAQSKTVKGKVTASDDGAALPGVNIVIKGTSTGTTTDVEGNFSVNVPSSESVLVFSFVGFLQQEIVVGNQSTIDIKLVSDVRALGEIVVVGYGEQKKRDITGSMASVTSKDFNVGAVASPEQLMQGRVAGVVITSANGDPGAAPNVRIRGGTSVNASNQPLYVIDGVPVDNTSATPDGGNVSTAPARNPLNTINPNDIESIDVLKDASAAAIYGSRGANGVILITTKKGKEGKTTLNYNTYYGVATVARYLPLLNAAEYKAEGARLFPGKTFGTADTDWQKEVFQAAAIKSHDVSFGGGTANTQYRVSLNYFNQDGLVRNSGMERVAARINATHKAINNKLALNLNLSVSSNTDRNVPYSSTGGFAGGLFTNILKMNPTYPVRNADGTYFEYATTSIRNPVALVNQIVDGTRTTRVLGSVLAEYEIISGLKASVRLGADQQNANRKYYVPRISPAAIDVKGEAATRNLELRSELLEANLTYNKRIMEDHNLTVLGGYSYQQFTREGFGAVSRNFITDAFGPNNLEAGGNTTTPPSSFKETSKLISFYGRVNYDIKGKYLITATVRRDGSSRFGLNSKWGLFPSGSIAWRISEEAFLKSQSDWLSDLKLRVGYGITGSQEIGNYRSLTLLAASAGLRAVFGSDIPSGVAQTQNPNPDLKWEQTAQLNVGLDYGFLNGKITGSIDYFVKRTTDLLLEFAIPQPAVVTTILANAGEIENKGLEIAVNATVMDKNDFKWEASVNGAFIQNKVVSLAGSADSLFRNGVNGAGQSGVNAQIIAPGLPSNSFYGPVFRGIDEKGAQKANVAERAVIGNPNPRFTYGINNRFSYKKFDLSFFLQGVQGVEVFNNTALEYVTKDNFKSDINLLRPAISDGTAATETPRYSSRWIEDGSFLRLSNAMLGYNFDVSKVKWLSSLRGYISGQNLFLITKYTGYDPEVSAAAIGIDYANYPRARTFMIGLNIGF